MNANLRNLLNYLGMAGTVLFLLMLFLGAPVKVTVIVLVLAASAMIFAAHESSILLRAVNLIIGLFILVFILTVDL